MRNKINVEAKILGIIPAQLSLNDLNKKINIININIKTKPKDFICELNNDCSISLYNTNNPFPWMDLISLQHQSVYDH